MPPSADERLKVNAGEIAAKVIDGEAILINLSTGIYYSLQGPGADAWSLVEAGHGFRVVVDALASRYRAPAGRVAEDLGALWTRLQEEGIAGPDGHEPAPPPPVLPGTEEPWAPPVLAKFTDMGDLLALDPPMPSLRDSPWQDPAPGA